jgi:DNA-binding MarR family transcriptional regulator
MPKNVRRTNPEPAKNWKSPTDDDKRPIFIHSALDEYGLNLYEFRILAHVARRESKIRGCDAAQGKMAKVCGMSQRMVLEVLAVLCEAQILRKEKTDGRRTNTYRLNPASKWKHPSELDEIRSKRKKELIDDQENEAE